LSKKKTGPRKSRGKKGKIEKEDPTQGDQKTEKYRKKKKRGGGKI